MKLKTFFFTIDIIEKNLGLSVTVEIEGSSQHKLQIKSLISTQQNSSLPAYAPFNSQNSEKLPAQFVLKLSQPLPMLNTSIQQIINEINEPNTIKDYLTSLTNGSKETLISLIARQELDLNKGPFGRSFDILKGVDCHSCDLQKHVYSVKLLDQYHTYHILDNYLERQDGVYVTKIPFTHPTSIPNILRVLRQQALFNFVVGSCIRRNKNSNTNQVDENTTKVLQESNIFDIIPVSLNNVCISFEHPSKESLATLEIDIRELSCQLYALDKESVCSNEYATTVLQKCWSIPITLRSVLKKCNERRLALLEDANKRRERELQELLTNNSTQQGLQYKPHLQYQETLLQSKFNNLNEKSNNHDLNSIAEFLTSKINNSSSSVSSNQINSNVDNANNRSILLKKFSCKPKARQNNVATNKNQTGSNKILSLMLKRPNPTTSDEAGLKATLTKKIKTKTTESSIRGSIGSTGITTTKLITPEVANAARLANKQSKQAQGGQNVSLTIARQNSVNTTKNQTNSNKILSLMLKQPNSATSDESGLKATLTKKIKTKTAESSLRGPIGSTGITTTKLITPEVANAARLANKQSKQAQSSQNVSLSLIRSPSKIQTNALSTNPSQIPVNVNLTSQVIASTSKQFDPPILNSSTTSNIRVKSQPNGSNNNNKPRKSSIGSVIDKLVGGVSPEDSQSNASSSNDNNIDSSKGSPLGSKTKNRTSDQFAIKQGSLGSLKLTVTKTKPAASTSSSTTPVAASSSSSTATTTTTISTNSATTSTTILSSSTPSTTTSNNSSTATKSTESDPTKILGLGSSTPTIKYTIPKISKTQQASQSASSNQANSSETNQTNSTTTTDSATQGEESGNNPTSSANNSITAISTTTNKLTTPTPFNRSNNNMNRNPVSSSTHPMGRWMGGVPVWMDFQGGTPNQGVSSSSDTNARQDFVTTISTPSSPTECGQSETVKTPPLIPIDSLEEAQPPSPISDHPDDASDRLSIVDMNENIADSNSIVGTPKPSGLNSPVNTQESNIANPSSGTCNPESSAPVLTNNNGDPS